MLTGRVKELELLEKAARDEQSHFIAVYGRRRVGKTFLIREAFHYRFTFQHAGLSEGGLKEQLFEFEASLRDSGGESNKPGNWLEAFEDLKSLIRESTEKKKVIFIDELSWMDTPRSDLMMALENFWNGWASARQDIVLIICTSATSWMLSKVIHSKGGLYNRLTEQIHLVPFTLGECEQYVRSKGIVMNRSQILQCYMVFGGVPFYWTLLEKGQSLAQNIDRVLFSEDAPLRDEFKYLYASIFRNPTCYLKIIQTLAKRKSGLTREEIIQYAEIPNSGDLSRKLDELESCGFIRRYTVSGKRKKGSIYQLIDFFTLFYYTFMTERPTEEHFWSNQINTPRMNTWLGLSFERVCLLHVPQIKQKLGISGVYTEAHAWYGTADPEKGIHGSQIDLLIERRDQVINLCEMKYSDSEYTITEKVDCSIRNKIHDLVTATGTKYAIHPTLVTTYGLVPNSYAGDIQAIITMEDLFGIY